MHVASATKITQHLLGVPPASRSFTWLPTTHPGRFCTFADNVISEGDTLDDVVGEEDTQDKCSQEFGLSFDSDQAVLSDILASDDDLDLSQTDSGQTDKINIVWTLPVSDPAAGMFIDHYYIITDVHQSRSFGRHTSPQHSR
jgi:hypothetical protein